MESKNIRSRTQAIQFLIRVGLKIDEFKVKCHDSEFVKEVDKEWRIEETADWVDQLSIEQKEIIGRAMELSKRKYAREIDRALSHN